MKEYKLKELTRYKGLNLILSPDCNQGNRCLRHSHDFIEIALIRGGSTRHVVYDRNSGEVNSYCLIRGDFFVILPGEIHGFTDNKNLQIFNLFVLPEYFSDDLNKLSTLPSWNNFFGSNPLKERQKLHLLPGEYEKTEKLLLKMQKALDKTTGNDYFALIARNLFFEYLIMISTHSPDEWHEMNGTPDERITRAVTMMETNPEQPFSVPSAAKKAGMSESLFNKKFKAAVGLSPLKYMICLRLERVRYFLRETTMPISRIAYETGFNDSNYMIKTFHRQYGITPAKYRKSY